jgi:hypothetical protein
MIKCTTCEHYEHNGAKHTCDQCPNKITYGLLQDPFIEACTFYAATEAEQNRRRFYEKWKNRPINDSGIIDEERARLMAAYRKRRKEREKRTKEEL